MASSLYKFTTSRLRRFKISSHRVFATLRLREFGIPDHRAFTTPRLREFQIPDHREFLLLKTCITNFINLDVSRVTGFPEFPNTSPLGKRVDSDDPIPQTFQNFCKKCHPRNVGGDMRHPETSQRSNRGAFAELPPPPTPINRRLPLSKFFTALFLCCEL
jgi:hypothetical protein